MVLSKPVSGLQVLISTGFFSCMHKYEYVFMIPSCYPFLFLLLSEDMNIICRLLQHFPWPWAVLPHPVCIPHSSC